MPKQRLKRIQAGRLVREVLYTPVYPNDQPKARAEKTGLTTAARQKINLRYSWQKLELMLAANFSSRDLFLTLTYDDAHLPPGRDEARKCLKQFFKRLRDARAMTGETLLYAYCTESRHARGRIHHHVVLNGTGNDYEAIHSLWEWGSNLEIRRIDEWGYAELAKYMTKEPRAYGKTELGERTWVASLNLRKPDHPQTQWVDGGVQLCPPANAHILERQEQENEWGRFFFVEYLLPDPPHGRRTRPPGERQT